MRKLQRQIDKEESKRAQSSAELEKLNRRLAKMRANCSHDRIEMNDEGVVVCKDCGEEVAYRRNSESEPPPIEDDPYNNYNYDEDNAS